MIQASETLDISHVHNRWDEIMGRCEGGEAFIITINGQPTARLEPANHNVAGKK